MSENTEDLDTETPKYWEGGDTEEERAAIRQAYELGQAYSKKRDKATLAGLQALYDAKPKPSEAQYKRLRGAFAAGSNIAYKKMTHNERAAAAGKKVLWETECAAIAKPPCFMHIPTGDALNDQAFTKKYGYLKKAKGPSVVMRANTSPSIARYHGVTYRPPADFRETVNRGIEVIEQGDDGAVSMEYFNTYKANPLTPLRDGIKPRVFFEHINYLVPDVRERTMLCDWLADLIQHPGQKRMFAILLIGGQGTGKSWLADLMRVILGRHNVSTPRSSTLKRDFNGWAGEKLLAIIHELKGTGITAENLQDIITQPTLEINRKGVEAIESPNFISMFLISNHEDCLPMNDGTRRYLVIQCANVPRFALDEPSDRLPYTRTPEMRAYYRRLFGPEGQPTKADKNGIDPTPTDETRRVLAWLQDRKITLDCQSIAPPTKAKAKVVDAGQDTLASLMSAAFRNHEPPFNSDEGVFAATDVVSDIDAGMIKTLTPAEGSLVRVTTQLRHLGCEAISEQNVRTVYGKKYLWAMTSAQAAKLRKVEPKQLARMYLAARIKGQAENEAALKEAQADAKLHKVETPPEVEEAI